jgi:hypothetical protein
VGGADGFAEAALDAVAIDGLAEGLGDGEADAGAGGEGAAGFSIGPERGARGVEVGELLAELLATGLVDDLVVSVFAEAMGHRGDARFGDAEMRVLHLESRISQTQKRAQGEFSRERAG